MNRRQRRRAEKLKQIPSSPAVETGTVPIPPGHADLLSVGHQHHQAGRLAEAEACYRRVLAAQPGHAEALHLLGIIAHQAGRHGLAVRLIGKAVKQDGQNAAYFCSLGIALKSVGKLDEAVTAYRLAIRIKPDLAEAHSNLGNALRDHGRLDEAIGACGQAIRIKPDLAEAHSNLGNALRDQGKLAEALASYDRALSLRPNNADVLNNRGATLYDSNRLNEALASYDRALALRPDYTDALNNRGATLHDLNWLDEALASYDLALCLRPDHAETLYRYGATLHDLNRLDEALASYNRTLAVKADHAHAFDGAADVVMKLCDWDRQTWFAAELNAPIYDKKYVTPFVLLGYSDDPALQLECARNHIENMIPSPPPPLWSGQTWRHDKVRVAYLSPNFRRHPMAFLTAEMFEQHDRSRFEIIGVSFGVDDRSEMRKRLVAAFDEFHDVRRMSDKEVAKFLNDRQLDIAVDLNGHKQFSRLGIFAHRPSPIQVNYIGFPATMGADFIDYIIADAMVLPVEKQAYYTEKVVYLPDCYQVNDTKRKIAERTPTRQEMGLPEHVFVFCCFNNIWKITREIFDIWMSLLHHVEGSVLWLLRDNEGAERSLRKEAQRREIDPSRLIFVGRLPPAEHLARHRLADLFLDTLPYNAHTTASDALWGGLPVLTCKGEAFAGRVAASLLQAIGLPELITANLEDYQVMALKLARDPAWLAEIKAKLLDHRNTYPLFDTVRFTRHIEAAYTTMWETWQRGEAPKSFSVEPMQASPVPISPSKSALTNRTKERCTGKLGQIPSCSAVETGTVAVPPGDTDLLSMGRKHHRAGRLAEAEACYRRVLAAQPDHADALHLLGIIAHQTARHDLAVGLVGQAIKQNGQNAAYFCSLGIALKNQGELDEAVTAYRQAIRINPDLAEAHSNLGNALRDHGRLDEAISACSQAIRIKPDLAEAHSNLGNALRDQGKLDEALASYDRALSVLPDHADVLNNRGLTLHELKRFEEALATCDRTLSARPDHVDALNNRGTTLHDLNRLDEALASYDRALSMRPDHSGTLNNRGNTLRELNRLDEALASYDRALSVRPDHAGALSNRGNALRELNRLDEALASCDKAIALAPNHADAFTNRALCRLLAGRYSEGWSDYEWRWDATVSPGKRPKFANFANWRGEDLEGHRLLIFSEQGLGDTIQFVRYLPLLAGNRCRLAFLTGAKLTRLLRPVTSGSEVITTLGTERKFDFRCALMSLPHRLGTDLASIPNSVPYLRAEDALIARWRERIGEHGFKIGIAWRGNPQGRIDQGRSIPLTEYVALARLPGVRLVSLQKDHGLDQLRELPDDVTIETLGDNFDNGPDAFIDTAAAMSSLDLVVSCDSSIAHLAGALGRPTWIALKQVPHWVWMLDRQDSPWYPTVRLFRQSERDNWKPVFANMERELRSLVSDCKVQTTSAHGLGSPSNPTVRVSWGESDLLPAGLKLHQAGRLAEAEACYRRVLAAQPDHAGAYSNLGAALRAQGKIDEAIFAYRQAIRVKPDFTEAHSNLGNALRGRGKLDEALASCDRALFLRPDYAEALNNRGLALHELKRYDEALASYDRALSLRPDHVAVLYNRGRVLHELKRLDDALASYDRALSLRPDSADALYNRGGALHGLKRHDEALVSYDRALSVRPDYAEALNNRGSALLGLKRHDEALASCDRALSLRPDHADALNNRGSALRQLNRLDEALVSYDRLRTVNADHPHAFSGAADCVMKLCDWDRRTRFTTEITAHVFGKKSIVSPFVLLGYSGDPALQLQCARNYIRHIIPSLPSPFWSGQTWDHDKLRVAYLSADFRSHPVAFLTAELFEQHDRSRFEIIGVSFGVDDRSEMRKRLIAAFDEFHDVRGNSDKEIAKLLNDRHFDVAVDLAGYTQDSRPGILAYRPAPIQVSFLGFPATMGADFVDYIIADRMVLPVEHQSYYAENVVYLPDCYQVNDTKRKLAAHTPTRHEMGLPDHAFVFCCFNNNWKITPEIFDTWMRLMHQVDGSVLWLLRKGAERNLRKEAQRRGIDPSRLVFAEQLPPAEHLARHRLANLFLDTLPYNAHTTASDALWGGLPVLTCKGEAFAGRVAASLLHAIGIPELITPNLEDYQALALKLAHDPTLLTEIKAKLMRNCNTSPLYHTGRFARHIEAAYTTMWETWQRGEVPKSFIVEPIDLPNLARASPAE